MTKYAVFATGQIWALYCSDGWARGYPNRARAVQAAFEALEEDAPLKPGAELLLQDETGFVGSPDLSAYMARL